MAAATFYMMIGLPASGKSTWVNQFVASHSSTMSALFVVSTDDIIEMIGNRYGMTYNQVFDELTYSFAEKMSHKLARHAIRNNMNLIWDQTNLTEKSRARKLNLVPVSVYKRIAVYFPIPDDLDKRLLSRPGKNIPSNVIENMKNILEEPKLSEGFDQIIVVKS